MAALDWGVASAQLAAAFETAVYHDPRLQGTEAQAAAIGLLRTEPAPANAATLAGQIAYVLQTQLGYSVDDATRAATNAAVVYEQQLEFAQGIEDAAAPAALTAAQAALADARRAARADSDLVARATARLTSAQAAADRAINNAGGDLGAGVRGRAPPPIVKQFSDESRRRARDAAIASIARRDPLAAGAQPRSPRLVTFFKHFSRIVIEGNNKSALIDPEQKDVVRRPVMMGLDDDDEDVVGLSRPVVVGPPSPPTLEQMSLAEAWREYERGRFEINPVLEHARVDAVSRIRLKILACLDPKSKVYRALHAIPTIEVWFERLMSDRLQTVHSILYDFARVHYNRAKSASSDTETSITNLRHNNTIEAAAMAMLLSRPVISQIVAALYR